MNRAVLPAALVITLALAVTVGQSPAAQAATTTSVTVDGKQGGRTFDGVGAISGGGGNSRLLVDYPEPQRSQILDYLFKPGYGANVQLLKLEIGGDANSTDGAEPSVEHVKGTVNCSAGYEFWLAEQARARNPHIQFYGLAWAAPGWIGGGTNYWTKDSVDYLVSWLGCAKSHGIAVSYLGGRNEKGHDKAWYESLRSTLDADGYGKIKIVGDDSVGWKVADDMVADPAFDAAVDVAGSHYPCGYKSAATTCTSTANALATAKPLWASENGSLDVDSGAAALVRSITRGYLDAKLTAYLNWPLVAAITPNLPFATVGLAVAPSPWSGSYRLGKETWAMAQFTQFTSPGWKFIDSASGYLGGDRANGSYVSLRSPNGKDYSTIVETLSATADQSIHVKVAGGLSTGTVHVRATNLDSANASDYFVPLPDVSPSNGAFSLTLKPGFVYSLSTVGGQGKGTAAGPENRAMSLPYNDTFDGYAPGAEARYVADMQGSFEIRACRNGRTGMCEQQVAPVKPIEWQGDSDAYALAGDTTWQNYTVSVDVNLQQAGTVELIGRANKQARPQNKQAGYELRLSDSGSWLLAKNDTTGTLTTLASGTTTAPGLNSWHRLSLDLRGSTITAKLGSTALATVTDSSYATGQIGFGVVGYRTDQFDNLTVTP
ncbi:galactosylceramidase [Kutzneria buriramensis]|uniref:galactosylceramidase n=1 Tax=Kutzneria buriramensis TaxID=1045776 RepID=A0A3E0HKB2_9PSEU|nr:galactosylceramidase [Kutzneria buriramensis]REH46847.1 O-glycosyl hydrolase [Kutzneria buriramensis]